MRHTHENEAAKQLVGDIIVDNILVNLDAQDIVNLRQVSSQYRDYTNIPVVWKRIVEVSENLNLPPVPPTMRYSFPNLTRIEAERLVTRSISLPAQWDKNEPTCLRRWEIDAPRIVLEMALLPGGQYLVASVMDHSRTRYSIEVFTSDFKYSMGFPVARLDTKTQAFDLRAKYMTIHDRQGIVVAYVRRDYRRERYVEKFDVNRIPIDSEGPVRMLKYECVAVHIHLSSLELLCDDSRPMDRREYRTRAMQEPRPFQVLTEIISRSRISSPVIDEDVHNAPFIAALKHPDRIVYKNLNGGLGCTMELSPHPLHQALPHTIMSFNILPTQHQFLVVRRAGINPPPPNAEGDDEDNVQPPLLGPYYFAELYDIVNSPGTTAVRTSASRSGVHDSAGNYWRKVWLSDHGLGPSLANDPSVRSYLHARGRQTVVPQPITVFVDAAFSFVIHYETLFPVTDTAGGKNRVVYKLSEEVLLGSIERLEEHMESLADLYERRILPGSARPITVSIPRKGAHRRSFEIRMLGAVWDKHLLKRGPHEPEDNDVEESQQADSQNESDAGSESPRGQFKLDPGDLSEVSAIAWDETIGRLCIGYGAAKNTRIAVFDFAGAPVRADVWYVDPPSRQ